MIFYHIYIYTEFDSQLFGIKWLFPSFLKCYSGVVETDGFSASLPKFCYDEHVFFQLPDRVKNQGASMDRGQQGLGFFWIPFSQSSWEYLSSLKTRPPGLVASRIYEKKNTCLVHGWKLPQNFKNQSGFHGMGGLAISQKKQTLFSTQRGPRIFFESPTSGRHRVVSSTFLQRRLG